MKKIFGLTIINAALILALGCSAEHNGVFVPESDSDPFAQKLVQCDAATISFEEQLYPQIKKSCAECHGKDETPLFAVTNLEKAFKRSLVLVNFQSPKDSVLIEQASNDHCSESGCQGKKPALNAAVEEFAKSVNFCRAQQDKEPIDPAIAFNYFKKRVRPTLEHHCASCHGEAKSFKPIDEITKRYFKAPKYLLGSTQTVYDKAKQYLALDKNSFYAAPMYGSAALSHFSNTDCKDNPSLEQEEQAPCLQIIEWWRLEKEYLDSL